MKRRLFDLSLIWVAFVALLFGCGGGGGGSSSGTAQVISGVAATGAPIVNGLVKIKDATGFKNYSTRTATDGAFSCNVTGGSAPFFLKITAPGNITLHSVATSVGTAHINPLTNIALANAAGVTDPATVFTTPQNYAATVTATKVQQAIANIQNMLQPLLADFGVSTVNPITGSFTANGTGLDRVLDNITITLNGGGVTVVMGATTLINNVTVTLNTLPMITTAIPTRVYIENKTIAAVTSGTVQFTKTVIGTNKNVTWSVVEASGGTIDQTGFYRAPGSAGTYHVRLTSNADATQYDTATVTVTVAPQVMTQITVAPSTATLTFAGATQQMTATAKESNGTALAVQPTFTWTSSNTGVATVSSTGIVIAVANGTTTITATSGSVSGTATITVNIPPIPVLTTITVTPATTTLTSAGATVQLSASGKDQNGGTMASQPTFTWTSSNTGATTVSFSGLVTAVANGSATITATSGSVSGTATVVVNIPVVAPAKLPKTGQTTSYAAGDDGDLQKGVAWPTFRFTDDGNSTITDNLTGLIWTKDGNAPGPAACDPATTKTWQGALDYVACLCTNNYLGFNDWRLPNRKELRSLVNYGQSNTDTWLNGQGFSNVQASMYWSSSTNAFSTDSAWGVGIGIGNGFVNFDGKTSNFYVLPVRAGQSGGSVSLPKTGQTTSHAAGDDGALQKGVAWPTPRFTDNANQTITDNLTGLIWTKDGNAPGPAACGPGTFKSWQGALDYVACLNTNSYLGFTDWRLPDVHQLESMVNAEQSNTASWLNGQGFTNVQASGYWSSSTLAFSTIDSWLVDMIYGYMGVYNKAIIIGYIWPVRGGQ